MRQFGDHDVLAALDRDSKIYNFQYTYIQKLEDKMFRAMKPGPKDVYVMFKGPPGTVLLMGGSLDSITFQRKLRGDRIFEYLRPDDLLASVPLPERIYVALFPIFFDQWDFVRGLRRSYDQISVREFEDAGYRMELLTLQRKTPPSTRRLAPPKPHLQGESGHIRVQVDSASMNQVRGKNQDLVSARVRAHKF